MRVSSIALLLLLHAAAAHNDGSLGTLFVSRRPACRRRQVSCHGGDCITCPEIGASLVRTLISLRTSLTRGNPSFNNLVRRFESFIGEGGRADLTTRDFNRDCCLRIFGTQVAREIPAIIAYGYIGREVFPSNFLLGYNGFRSVVSNPSLRAFVGSLGPSFRGQFFNLCRFSGIFELPCLRGPLTSLAEELDFFINLGDIRFRNANRIGFFVGQGLGAFTSSAALIERDLRAAVRRFSPNGLERCCPPP